MDAAVQPGSAPTRQQIMLRPGGAAALPAELVLPPNATGVVVFAHGSGSSRHSPRNRQVAQTLQACGLGTLLFDLLTPEEAADRVRVFDIPLLAARVLCALDALDRLPRRLKVGLFGASTGAAAALMAAAERPSRVAAVVSRGGRPDLAGTALARVQAPTLLIVGSADPEVLALNRQALAALAEAPAELAVVRGATHLFEEPGALGQVAQLAADWFEGHLAEEPDGAMAGLPPAAPT